MTTPLQASPDAWQNEWPNTDFAKHSIDFSEILSGGPPKDGIPAIDKPMFQPLDRVRELQNKEAVIGLEINGDARAYPIRILMWHEIVNDTVGGVPVTVTYCPLCNAAIVFERRTKGGVLSFGTTGKLRTSDLVMYDRQTESWWQQFTGEAIVGKMTGQQLTTLPSRLESFAHFRKRHPKGRVLVANDPGLRDYGRNPYENYDLSAKPFLYRGTMPDGISPMARVVVVRKGKKRAAVSLRLLREKKTLRLGSNSLSWQAGQASALEDARVAGGRDVGNVIVQRKGADGRWVDAPYDVTFAFVFHAFHPELEIWTDCAAVPSGQDNRSGAEGLTLRC